MSAPSRKGNAAREAVVNDRSMGQLYPKGADGMMWYMLSVKRENACYPKTLEMLDFENYESNDGYTFESEYFCDVEEKADCLIEMGIDFQFDVLPDYGNISRLVYDKAGYLEYKRIMNEL